MCKVKKIVLKLKKKIVERVYVGQKMMVTGDCQIARMRIQNFTLVEHYKSSVISTTMDIASSVNNHYISRECFEPTSMPSIM